MLQVWADFDGDGVKESAAVYRLQNDLVVALYKHNGLSWYTADWWRASGTDVTSFYAAPAYSRGPARHNLVIGWQDGGETAYLSVYEWAYGRFRESARYVFAPGNREITALPARRETLYPASEKTAEGTWWGYINAAGQWAIRPRYDYAFDFQSNGLAIVQVGDRSGVIDTSGQYVVKPVYSFINPFTEGLAVVSDGKGYHVINESGAQVTAKAYDYISPYRDGRALYSVINPQGQSAYGYLDTSGKEVIPAQFMEGYDFRDGKAVVKVKDGEYALIGRGGERLAAYPYPYVGPLSEGMLAFQKEQPGKYGYLNEQGEVAIAPQFTGAQPFQQSRAVVNTSEDYKNRYGLIDRSGSFVVQPEYNEIRQLGEGRIALGKALNPEQPYLGSKFAVADLNGSLLSDFIYYDAADYEDGYASVQDGRSTYFIDRSGRKAPGLPSVQGTGTLSFVGTLIKADVDQRVSYLDRSGRVIWQPNKVIPLAPPYRVVEHKYKPNKDYLVYYPQVEGIGDPAVRQKVNDRLKELSQVKPVDPGVQLDYSYTGDFGVSFFRKQLLVLELNGYNYPFGAAHGMPYRVYAHVDLVTGRFYELKDLFKPGSDYVKVLSGIIGVQIKSDPEYSYVWPDSYKGIKPDQPFYVNEDTLFIYFAPYEIAPYAAGFPTFRIPFREIMGIIDTGGAFWRSFHG